MNPPTHRHCRRVAEIIGAGGRLDAHMRARSDGATRRQRSRAHRATRLKLVVRGLAAAALAAESKIVVFLVDRNLHGERLARNCSRLQPPAAPLDTNRLENTRKIKAKATTRSLYELRAKKLAAMTCVADLSACEF